MYNILVLGQIPGTNIRLSFQAWIALMALLVGGLAVAWIEFNRRVLHGDGFIRTVAPNASQLHSRLARSVRLTRHTA